MLRLQFRRTAVVRNQIEGIIRALSFTGEHGRAPLSLSNGNMRQWRNTLEWLDSTGLALYFLHVLRTKDIANAVPVQVLGQLEWRREKNVQRISLMQRTFETINQGFSDAGVEFLVLKGFSLVPEYSPDQSLRAQSDLDYLVAPSSMRLASQILVEQGYQFKEQTGQEFVFWIPAYEPISSATQYNPGAPFVIELHLSIWDESRLFLSLPLPKAVFGRANLRQMGGAIFPSLPAPQIFLHQMLHAFQHVVTGRVRLCQFFEIAHFMNRSADASSFWNDVECVLSDPMLRHIAGLVSAMGQTVFPSSRAAVIKRWCEELTPAVRLWVENYSGDWLIEGAGDATRFFSSAKLVMFLQEQYVSNSQRRALRMRSLLPFVGLRRIVKPASVHPNVASGIRSRIPWLLSRLRYHFGSNLRYLFELPRWWQMRRSFAARSVPAS